MTNKYSIGGPGTVVDAIYTPAKCPVDEGNLMIEALPDPVTGVDALSTVYTRSLPDFNPKEIRSLSRLKRRQLVSQLRYLRLYLPFEESLEHEFYNSLVNSYRLRTLQKVDCTPAYYRLIGHTGEAANAGFNLLGYSGCGKSSAIGMLVNHCPQVIRHRMADGTVLSQIVYLVVSCNPTNDFSALYEAIGREIDRALGTNMYERMLSTHMNLGRKLNKVIELIEKFGIGLIILDEIQQLSFGRSKSNTFESLLSIVNTTKVALAVVGTEEAYEKMFSTLRTARRAGYEIPASNYCGNKPFFKFLMRSLLNYQWFDNRIPITDDIIETMYVESHGIIDQAITLWMAVQDEYLKRDSPVDITPEFISRTFSRRYPRLRELLNAVQSQENDDMIRAIMMNADREHEHELEMERQNQAMNNIISSAQTQIIEEVISRTVSSIQVVYRGSTSAEIERLCRLKIADLPEERRSVEELAPIVLDELRDPPRRRTARRNRTVSTEDMLNSVMNSGRDQAS